MGTELVLAPEVSPAETASLGICQLADAFIASLDVVENSRWTYRRALKAFFAWVGESGRADRLNSLNRFDILAYKDDLARTRRPATVNMYPFIIRRFYGWLEENNVRPDITRGVKQFKLAPGHAKDCLTVEQVRRILDGIDRRTAMGLRDYALVNLMVRTGLREIEVSRATVGDLREESGEPVLWVHGKGRTQADAFVLLVPAAVQPIRPWMAGRLCMPEVPLFPSLSRKAPGTRLTTRSISKIVKTAMRRVGIDSRRLTPHSLRHTAISLAIAGGASLAQAQAMARHSKPSTTMIYFHNWNRVKDAAEKCVNF